MVPVSTKKVIGKTMCLSKRSLFRTTMRRFRKKETGNPLQNKCNQTAEKSIEEKKRLHDVPPSVVKAVSWFFKG